MDTEQVQTLLLRARRAIDRAKNLSQALEATATLTPETQEDLGVTYIDGSYTTLSTSGRSENPHLQQAEMLYDEPNHTLTARFMEHTSFNEAVLPLRNREETSHVTSLRETGTSENTSHECGIVTCHNSNALEEPESSQGPEPDHESLLRVASHLVILQEQQAATLTALLSLRQEQLRLRQQQLSALQDLLRREIQGMSGTELQRAAVEQAVRLLAVSSEDMGWASQVLSGSGGICGVLDMVEAVAMVDGRAEEVSRMARQLLEVLRVFPRLGEATDNRDRRLAATSAEISAVPVTTAATGSVLIGSPCSICLSEFQVDENIKALGCLHYLHAACLDEWLRVDARCPLCKTPLHQDLQEQAVT